MAAIACHIMRMRDRSSKRPTDPNQLAKLIVELASGETSEPEPVETKNKAAVALGRLGGLKGGNARAASLSAEERSQAAQRAAKARWERKQKP